MSGAFNRAALPDWPAYADAQGLTLIGRGEWRTTACEFHGGSDSMRVKVTTGGWVCMACGAHGGDVLAYHMQRHGLGFVEAARALGAYADDGKPHRGATQAETLPARDAMQLAAHELRIAFVVISDVRAGVIPNDGDWQRFIDALRHVETLAGEYPA